jgi:AcrR family transcriptional regulator
MLSEQARIANTRAYRMRKRAEDVTRTRARIVEATVQLHGSIGFAATTVAGIARQAGVTRLTVYRHFPDVEDLYAACKAHWAAQQQRPNVDAWTRLADPTERLRSGLSDLYRFYRGGEAMLTFVDREREMLPAKTRHENEETDAHLRDTLLQPFAASGAQRRRLRAVLGHAVKFPTWRSLCVEQGLTDREAVEVMAALALSVANEGLGGVHRQH